MKDVLRAFLAPTTNRYYTGTTLGLVIYVLKCIPFGVLLIVYKDSYDSPVWLILGIYILLCIIYYTTYDKLVDYLQWHGIFKRDYGSSTLTDEEKLMKSVEKNSSHENLSKLHTHLTRHDSPKDK